MKKLLHERLREWVSNTADGNYFPTSIALKDMGLVGVKDSAIEDEVELFNLMADEIEKYYIPKEQHEKELYRLMDAQGNSAHYIMKVWAEEHGMPMKEKAESISQWLNRYFIPRPMFEDGEPVQFGDIVDSDFGGCNALHIYDEGIVHIGAGNAVVCVRLEKGKFLKRPQPKVLDEVLDADGVKIKVGDTCWYTDNIHTEEYIGNRVKITEIFGEDRVNVFNYDVGHRQYEILGSSLTHKEPDSFKKLLRDMMADDPRTHNSEYSERLAALIERGAW